MRVWQIRGTQQRIEQEQDQEPKSKMGDPYDILSGTNTNTKNGNFTEVDNNQSNTSLGQVTHWEIVTTRKNTRSKAANKTSGANKDHKGDIEICVAVLALIYSEVDLNESFDVLYRSSSTTRLKNWITLKTFLC